MSAVSITTFSELINTVECGDGYRLKYRVWRAKELPLATLLLINGMMSHSGWFRELAEKLTALQLNIVGADRRGSGLNQGERGDVRDRNVLLSDLRRIIAAEECGVPVYLVGWCWGAVLALNAALEPGNSFRGLVLLAPGIFPSEQIKQAMPARISGQEQIHAESPLLESPIKEEMFTDIARYRDIISADHLAVRAFTTRFFDVSRKMMLVAAARLSKLSGPVLLLLAARDQAVDNRKTLEAFQKLSAVHLSWATLPYNHGLQLEAAEEIASNIARWLAAEGVPIPNL